MTRAMILFVLIVWLSGWLTAKAEGVAVYNYQTDQVDILDMLDSNSGELTIYDTESGDITIGETVETDDGTTAIYNYSTDQVEIYEVID